MGRNLSVFSRVDSKQQTLQHFFFLPAPADVCELQSDDFAVVMSTTGHRYLQKAAAAYTRLIQ